ncbi:uncharacterized protein (DUF305 family) [Thermocatellispora tengchongensis]|uniref:Uncharacterized protein (DUF305 family) n=1 Tax=Thermocatellispora tengchongensis TaxID=1073253 RepID=A0A840NXC2_9ACTN|nr:DUF305 domain-containing protein [Thermocatellispora tengchongensis]MBB5131429.1 uncharacterized protein (DUF305 family) [Thermocatellispora tengchongensis]
MDVILRTAAAGAAVLALAGCSSAPAGPADADSAVAAGARTAATTAATAAYNESDVRFCREMIPHHMMTIELAELVTGRTTDPYVTSMAERIAEGEDEEIDRMTAWLEEWRKPPPGEAHLGHDGNGLDAEAVAELERASGRTFDRLWLRAVADHLEHGVRMAETVLAVGRSAPATMLAGQMVTELRADVEDIEVRLRQI